MLENVVTWKLNTCFMCHVCHSTLYPARVLEFVTNIDKRCGCVFEPCVPTNPDTQTHTKHSILGSLEGGVMIDKIFPHSKKVILLQIFSFFLDYHMQQ